MMGEIQTSIGILLQIIPDIQSSNPIAALGSIIALVTGAIGTIIMVRKNKAEERAGLRDYQKDTMLAMSGDMAKLRKHSEKYLILRKIVILEPAVDHIEILRKMEEQYDIINPDPGDDD